MLRNVDFSNEDGDLLGELANIWVNYNDLTVLPSPGIMVYIWGIIPKWPQVSG
jgi:hypothetical protein